jgi:hypothetical protein
MKIISHRGNLNGKNLSLENKPEHILDVCKKYDVEIDAWFINDQWFLGHDKPQYEIKYNFFNEKMWIHCKNIDASINLYSSDLNWFWHENDKFVLTSKKNIWCYPGIYIEKGITVELTHNNSLPKFILGICTDYPEKYSE